MNITELREKLDEFDTDTERIMYVWSLNEGHTVMAIAKLIGSEYQAVYGTLRRKGVTSEEIKKRHDAVKESDARSRRLDKTARDWGEVKWVISRTARTTQTNYFIEDTRMHRLDFAKVIRRIGRVIDDVPYLAKVDFTRCDLREASFAGVDLNDVTFTSCDLRRTNLSCALSELAHLDGHPSNHTYRRLSFKGCDMRGTKLSGRKVTDLTDCWLVGMDFTGITVPYIHYSPDKLEDERTGFSQRNMDEGSYIHLERSVVGNQMVKGVPILRQLRCGAPPYSFVPPSLAICNNLGMDRTLEGVRIFTHAEWERILRDPSVQDLCVGGHGYDREMFSRSIKIIFGVDLDVHHNYNSAYTYPESVLNRTMINWVVRHYEELSTPGNPDHPRPVVGTDPMIRHLELFRMEDLGPAGERANPDGVLRRMLERVEREVQEEIENRVGQNADKRGVKFPNPNPKKIPPVPTGVPIHRIETYEQLVEEGVRMQHCVGGYAGSAIKGHEFFYHVGEPAPNGGTLSLNSEGESNQFRGYHNCVMSEETQQMVRRWLKGKGN